MDLSTACNAGNDGDDDYDDELDDLTQDEVLSLKLPSSSSGISTRYLHQKQQQEDDDDDEEGDARQTTTGTGRSAIKLNTRMKNRDRDLQPLTDARTSRFDKLKQDSKRKRETAASDEEEEEADSDEQEARQDGEQQDSDDESAASSSAADPDKEDLKGSWATAGGYYLSKGEVARAEERQHRQQEGRRGQVDDEQREQEALELYEARRIQKEGKENLHEADYGLDSEGDEEDATRLADMDMDLSASPRAKDAQAPARFDTREEAIAHLVSTEPELLALLDDLSRNAERLPAVKAVVKNMQVSLAGDNPRVGFGLLYQGELWASPPHAPLSQRRRPELNPSGPPRTETLTTYLTTLVFYLHVRSHPSFPSVGGDIASAALDRLLKLREALSTLDDLGIGATPEDEQRKDMYTGSDEEGDSAEEADGDDDEEDALALEELDRETLLAQIGDLDDDELEALIAERRAIMEHEGLGNGKTNGIAAKQAGKRRALQAAEGGSESDEEQDIAQPAKRSRKRRRTKQAASSAGAGNTLGDLLNLAPLPATSRAARPSVSASADSDLVDPTALSAGDAEDKAGRSKSLRFYTSKIAAASARRTGANRERGGGDDDVPYRSKERARAAVLQRQQHAQKVRDAAGAELDDAEFGEDDLVDARAVSGSLAAAEPDADAEGYYDLVSKGKKAARAAKKEAYDAAVEEDR